MLQTPHLGLMRATRRDIVAGFERDGIASDATPRLRTNPMLRMTRKTLTTSEVIFGTKLSPGVFGKQYRSRAGEPSAQ